VAPGPVVRTTTEVLDALRELPTIRSQYAQRYAAFRRTFCHLEDGHAGDRVARLLEQRAPADDTDHELSHRS
jgi:CDP-glycerol glycerophosphotransferase